MYKYSKNDVIEKLENRLRLFEEKINSLTKRGVGGGGNPMTALQILAALLTVDGTGSTLDADKLDGQHASDFASIPSGAIVLWKGTIATIPSGWYLCNGLNGTPDLRDKFVVGAKQDDSGVAKTNITGSLLQSGGANTHDHDNHSDHVFTQPSAHTISSHTGTAVGDHGNHVHSGPADHAAHTHNQGTLATTDHATTSKSVSGSGTTLTTGKTHSISGNTGNPSAALSHGNTGNETATLSHSVTQPSDHSSLSHSGGAVDSHSAHSTENNIPAFYSLAFIMKA